MTQKLQPDAILGAVKALGAEDARGVSSSEIHARVGGSYADAGAATGGDLCPEGP